MNVCRWCTPSGLDATEYLKSYASKQLSPEDLEGSNDDLCYCLECVVEYHKAREKLPSLHQVMERIKRKESKRLRATGDQIVIIIETQGDFIRRWAILTARNLGKVDRDDYYDLQEVLTCLFKVIELGLFESPDIYRSSVIEKGKLILLPSHLYDNTNYKNYWLGICMLLTVLEEQALDSLLLGPDKQNDFMQTKLIISPTSFSCNMQDTGWKTAICPDYCPNMYEDMQTLADVLQSDIGRDMRVHHSTFLWFIPFVQSLMDLKDLGVAYIVEVIHYLCSEIKDILNERIRRCDKVSEFFLLILVSIIELHRNKKCLHLLWISSQEWVEAVVRCAKLPAIAFTRCTEKAAGSYARGSATISLQASNSVQHACVQLIRSLLREGYQIGQHALCKQYLDKLNLLLRGNLSLGWQLNIQETQELQICLKQVIRSLKSRAVNASASVENNANSTALPTASLKQEKSAPGDGCKMSAHGRENLCSPVAFIPKEGEDGRCQENSFTGRNSAWEEDCKDSSKNSKSLTSTDCILVNIKKEPKNLITQECKCLQKSFAKEMYGKVQENRNSDLMSGNCDMGNQGFNASIQSSNFRRSGVLENKQGTEAISPMCLSAQTSADSPEHVCSSDVRGRNAPPGSSSKFKEDAHRLGHLPFQACNAGGHSRLLPQIGDLKNSSCTTSASEAEQPVFCTGSSCMRKDCCKHQGVNIVGENEDRESADISRSSGSTWEKSAFQYGLVSKNQEQKEMPLDCFSFAKNQPGLQGNKDNSVLLADISDAVLQNVSTKGDSSLLMKSVCLKDQEQPNLSDLVKCDCKGQISKTSCTVKNSVSGHVPSSSENKGGMSNTALPVRPLAVKCESSERLIVCSKYFKRENNTEGKEEEDFVRIVSGENASTNSQIDIDLSKLSLAAYAKSVNFPSESSQESSVHQNICDVKRKVKSAVRSSSDAQSNQSLCDTDSHGNKIIIILDSSDEENGVTVNEETKEINENTCPEKQPLSEMQRDVTDSRLESKMPNSPLPLEDCDSQYFEFETEVDVFSVWQDTQEYKQGCVSTSADSSRSDGLLKDHTNEWGYDVDYISDEAVEKETDWTGEEINTSPQKKTDNTEVTNSTLQEFSPKENAKDEVENSTDKTTVDKDLILKAELTEPRASTSNISLASKLALKKSTLSPRKNAAKSKVARTAQRSPKATALNTTQTKKLFQSTLKRIQPGRTTPAVVPPKKARQCPAPTSTVEKLGLKKAPRKAFELSQRSLDSLAQLRSYGKVAGKVGVAQRGKLKRIAHPSLSTQINKKMLACQDLQFLKQTRLSKSVRVKNIPRSSEDRSKKLSTVDTKSIKQKAKCLGEPSVEKQREKKTGETFYPSVDERERITGGSVEKEAAQTTLVSGCSDSNKTRDCDAVVPPVPMDSSPCSAAVVGDAKGKPEGGCVAQPEFGMTASKENECKPDENSDDDDNLFLTQLDPVDMELCSQDEDAEVNTITTTRTEEMEIDSAERLPQNEPLTVVKCKHKDCTEKVEKVGDCCSKHSATNSESDHLFAKPSSLPPRRPSTTKVFSSVSSSRNAAFSKDLEDVEKQPPALKSRASIAKPAVLRPPSEKATPTRNQTCKTPSSSNIPQPHISNNHYSSFLGAQQHDHNIFVKEVLKWTYEMFANSIQFGPPNTLLQSVVASVPIRFQGYNDYFNTFFPLMMLNAFETLCLFSFYSSNFKMYFCVAYFEETDLTKQLHPKEDDLIFLVGQKKKDAFGEDSEVEDHLVNHVGLVRRFSRASGQKEQHIVCHLSVQTRGNLSFFINNRVKCMVVGSLVPTQRSFKGLLLLSRSPLAKPIINPSYSDFCPRDLPVASESAVSPVPGESDGNGRWAIGSCEFCRTDSSELSRQLKIRIHGVLLYSKVRGHSQKVQTDIILESDIICCTLSTSGGGLLESAFWRQGLDPFSCVIVDEAGQSCEVETLIPLIHRCNKLVLVGDPRQLPPTIKSIKAQEYGYGQSLMARLQRHLEEQVQNNLLRRLPVVQLTVQYRMHPDICLFPSSYVYGRTLKTDKATEENRCSSEWPFQPYLVFDVGDGREERDKDSFSNPQEVKLVLEIIRTIKEKRKDLGLRRIGIITPYSAQKKKIQEELDRVFKNNSPGEVDTVDAFQGREKDCIIVTCVRANSSKGSIGFLASLQRLNVTITRARFSLFILGRLKTLMENKDWNKLIQDAQRRGAIIKTSDKSYKKDALKILKLKPTPQNPPCQPPTKAGTTKAPLAEACSSSRKTGEPANPREAGRPRELAAGPGHAAPQGSRMPQQPQGAQVAESRPASISAPVEAAALPADKEKPRDPRLASMASRTETKGKEQASKDSSHSAQSTRESTLQQRLDVSSAARDRISRTEPSKKHQQTKGQCDMPSTLPYAAKLEGDRRAPLPEHHSKASSERGQCNSSKMNKDPRTSMRRTSESSSVSTDSSSAKRRRTSH
uniref:Senataxin n=1 Tax=Pavo cristatus TaxID=9049 RepID=A0A8C9FHK9_PAVCR